MQTPHDLLVEKIASYAANTLMTFDEKSRALEEFISGLNDKDLQVLLSEVGFIPESYEHDSSEEKVYAKAMDIVVAVALRKATYNCVISVERSNTADVIALTDVGTHHKLVLDAKAFRLSRTALNPKDYKIEALDQWRGDADYACLVAPIAGFPQGDSRLFAEAVRYNVTLLTFSHLQFMLEHGVDATERLIPLWNAASVVRDDSGNTPDATQYWASVDRVFCEVLKIDMELWKASRRRYFQSMIQVADKQIAYYETERAKLDTLTKEELVRIASDALKLDNKISVIQSKKTRM